MKSILLLGDIGSIHLYNLIKNALCFSGYSITAVSSERDLSDVRTDYLDFYKASGIDLIDGVGLKKVGVRNYMLYYKKVFKSLGHYDVCLVQYVSHYLAPIVYLYRRRFDKIKLTFWGSDVYRVNGLKALMTIPLLKRADNISFITETMRQDFLSRRRSCGFVSPKSCLLDFGNLFFEQIDGIKKSTNKDSYSLLGIQEGKVNITVGYNGRKDMQQAKLCEQILVLPQAISQRIQVLIPAYGISDENKSLIEEAFSTSGVEYKLFSYFMGSEETTNLRAVSDIFLYGQTSDALSNSMLEHLYAGSIMLKGAWLNYETLDEQGVYYENFCSFDDVPGKLEEIIGNLDELKLRASKNHDIIGSFCSWQYWREKWLNFIA